MISERCLTNDNLGVIYMGKTERPFRQRLKEHLRGTLNPDAKLWPQHGQHTTQSPIGTGKDSPRELGFWPRTRWNYLSTRYYLYHGQLDGTNFPQFNVATLTHTSHLHAHLSAKMSI
ncbi:hypothetical protein ACOME3_003675 [Neoechinorhynchus agilis]